MVYENDDLRHELELYKSVAVPTGYKPRTHVTRVGRVPLGDQNVNAISTNAPNGGEEIFKHLPEMQYKEGDLTIDEIL